MRIFDSHCHYNLEPLAGEWEKHHSQALNARVTHSTIVGTTVETSKLAIEQAAKKEGLFSTCGIHPNETHDYIARYKEGETYNSKAMHEYISKEVEKLAALLGTKQSVAIGETGLDYYRLKSRGSKRAAIIAAQKHLFSLHLELAKQFALPVVVHVRDQEGRQESTAYLDTLALLKEHACSHFILHCISGPKAYVEESLHIGGYIGIAGNSTYAPNTRYLSEILKHATSTKVLVETDAPYLAPVPYRGQVCKPHMIVSTVSHLETAYGLSSNQLFDNACTFYGIQVQ